MTRESPVGPEALSIGRGKWSPSGSTHTRGFTWRSLSTKRVGRWEDGKGQIASRAGGIFWRGQSSWAAASRRRGRKRGKNDRLDARAVAKLVRQEGCSLPKVTGDDESAVLDLLVTEREAVLAEASRLRNQIQQLLLQVDPGYRLHVPNLQSQAGLVALETYAVAGSNVLQQQRVAAIRRLAQRLRLAVDQIKDLTRQIHLHAEDRFHPLTQICGVDLLTAGALAGILGPGRRFATEAQLAAYAGVAPLEASSAALVRHRLNRGGDRRLNAIFTGSPSPRPTILPKPGGT